MTVDRWIEDQLVVIEDVPVGVCRKCGERVFRGRVLEQVERKARNYRRLKRKMTVPVATYG
jgi:YgiT-type zinc finger domain-containing protein